MSGLKKAETLEDIRKYCRPEPLTGEQLESFFVETDQARDPHQKTRHRLRQALDDNPEDARLLLHGHRGCGKSTEINRFLFENRDDFFPVKFSIQDEMSPLAVRAEDLMLVLADRMLDRAKEERLGLDDDLLRPVLDYFSREVLTENECKDAGIAVETGVEAGAGLLAPILKVFVKLRGEIKHSAHSEETKTHVLRKRPADLLAQVNLLVEAVRSALPEEKRLLVVVEDLDKLDLKQAREVFLQGVNLLTGVRTNVIYTIPIFLFHSPDVNQFQHHFADSISMKMIKIADPDRNRAPGFDAVKEVVCQRLGGGTIEEDALDRLVEMTGGVLRHVFQVLHTAAASEGAGLPLDREHVEYGLSQLRQELWRSIALPYDPLPGGPESVDELYDRLAEYARSRGAGQNPAPPRADAVNQILLKTCTLVEYNGEGWFGVHPLVRDYLKNLGRIP